MDEKHSSFDFPRRLKKLLELVENYTQVIVPTTKSATDSKISYVILLRTSSVFSAVSVKSSKEKESF